MSATTDAEVSSIEIVEDFSATARCDEGFLKLRRLRCRNVRKDGSHSKVYRVDVIDRPRVDAVAVVIWRRGESGVELLLREGLRPAAWFRRELHLPVPETAARLRVREIVAGLLEQQDSGLAGVCARAAAEVLEEAGFQVTPEQIHLLGGAFLVAPGILSEKIFLTEVEVTGLDPQTPTGDGSPLEEGASVCWMPLQDVLAACASGELEDAKTELGARRLADRLAGTSP